MHDSIVRLCSRSTAPLRRRFGVNWPRSIYRRLVDKTGIRGTGPDLSIRVGATLLIVVSAAWSNAAAESSINVIGGETGSAYAAGLEAATKSILVQATAARAHRNESALS